MTAAGVKETLLENQQSFIVGKMDMKGKQKARLSADVFSFYSASALAAATLGSAMTGRRFVEVNL